jgi:hypothetical protein
MDFSVIGLLAAVMILGLNCVWVGIQLWLSKIPQRRLYARIQGSLLILLVLLPAGALFLNLGYEERYIKGIRPEQPILPSGTPEILKKDCQSLVEGQLLFEPSRTMRQGKPYPVFARLTRNPGVNIAEGLQGSDFVITKERVSCKVSMNLDSEEPRGFLMEKVPADRPDAQLLEPDKFSQWDWRVTPRRNGSLHLLLYVVPMLYVDGIGEGLKEFKQPPKVITVTPDYVYELTQFVKENWTIISGLLGALLIPLFLWFRNEIIGWLKRRFGKKKQFGFPIPPQ